MIAPLATCNRSLQLVPLPNPEPEPLRTRGPTVHLCSGQLEPVRSVAGRAQIPPATIVRIEYLPLTGADALRQDQLRTLAGRLRRIERELDLLFAGVAVASIVLFALYALAASSRWWSA